MSARLRLTLSYAGFLVIAGAAMIALLFYIIRFVPEGNLQSDTARAPRGDGLQPGPVFVPDRSDLLDALWPRTWQMLAFLAVIGLVGGWFLAGRMLRPLHRIHEVALRVAAGSLEPRVRLEGPADEFRQLAETFDSMLDRLERSFEEQRRFAANASHELRTPYAIERSMLDVALADPTGIDVDLLVRRLDETNRRGTETVEALLTLSRLDQGQLPPMAPVDLAEVTAEVVDRLGPLADQTGVRLETSLDEGDIDGDVTLFRQLVTNLVLNGIRHNIGSGGRVRITTTSGADGGVTLVVSNTGPVVPRDLLGTLTEPFVRGVGRSAAEGSGLGLAIVDRVARVHGGDLQLVAPDGGGLEVSVVFPSPQAG